MTPNGTTCPARHRLEAPAGNPDQLQTVLSNEPSRAGAATPRGCIRRLFGFMGVAAALPFFVWLPLGWLGAVPSIVDVFGMAGLRIPVGFTVGGLLIAAIGFHDERRPRRVNRPGAAIEAKTFTQSRRQD